MMKSTIRLLLLGVAFGASLGVAHAASREVERGKYLIDIIPCTDCHTPGSFLGHPDMKRYLGGSDVGFAIPHLGVFYGPNLTPDNDTGLGKWTTRQIVTAITEGVRPDGRKLAPPMPSEWFHHLTKADAQAIAAYLKTLPPVKNKVPGPFGPAQKPVGFVMQVIPADQYIPAPASGAAPPAPPPAGPAAPMPSVAPPSPPPAPPALQK
jgi:mono/diheme cytochrome c family protein